jgi:hypothetical protein
VRIAAEFCAGLGIEGCERAKCVKCLLKPAEAGFFMCVSEGENTLALHYKSVALPSVATDATPNTGNRGEVHFKRDIIEQ